MMKKDFPFLKKKKKTHIIVTLLRSKDFAAWLKKQGDAVQVHVQETGFTGKSGQSCFLSATAIVAGLGDGQSHYDSAHVVSAVQAHYSSDFLKTCSFAIEGKGDMTQAVIGWGLGCYAFTVYKEDKVEPSLVVPDGANMARAEAVLQSIYLLRDMVNTPANDMSPADIEAVAQDLAMVHKAEISVTKGKALVKEFPLVHMVGKAAEEEPRLIDLRWGKKSAPKLTLVGKGVSFDTGGLNIKPTAYMGLMKKDMGGSAHALALGHLIMALNLPVQLRVIVPAVENSISDEAFRPGDVVKSRKGLTVENTNTDAEGRLILADALAYACEDEPDLLIDFATLTGSARAALGPDIPAAFSTDDKIGAKLQKLSFKANDPVWIMPLWEPYKKHIQSSIADFHNSASLPGDLMYSALFLRQFVDDTTHWVHLDCHAWELSGKPGRPRGAADTGLFAALALVEDRYV